MAEPGSSRDGFDWFDPIGQIYAGEPTGPVGPLPGRPPLRSLIKPCRSYLPERRQNLQHGAALQFQTTVDRRDGKIFRCHVQNANVAYADGHVKSVVRKFLHDSSEPEVGALSADDSAYDLN